MKVSSQSGGRITSLNITLLCVTSDAQAAAARANAQDALARTSRAVESVQRAQQNAAQAAAGANNAGADPNHPGQQLPDVPNGLAPGGLQVAPGVGTDLSLWTGAFLPTQTAAGGKTQVVIKQTQQQALLNWQTFNVGKDTHLHFDQSDGKENVGQWTAFNKVNDPSGRPSQILGSITAPGQVYIINQNGIIFGGASQINTHTLVASSLPINDALIKDGLLNQGKTAQFLFSALPQAGTTPFVPPTLPAVGRIGDVTVQAGAQLTAPSNESKVGGRIALVGPNVTNAGSISTPDGQTILAAGLQVGFAAHSSADPSLRGLDVYIGAVTDPASSLTTYAGTATNTGSITAARGSAVMAGKDVRQFAAIDTTTLPM
jgi:filamentous hemagglutinin family protein